MNVGQNGLAGFLKNIFNFSKNGSFEIFKKTANRPAAGRRVKIRQAAGRPANEKKITTFFKVSKIFFYKIIFMS